jgi:membrane peptidoglycan carboxypeptidase
LIAVMVGGGLGLLYELKTSTLQAGIFSFLARDLSFEVADGPNPAARYPSQGPYDVRLGYERLGEIARTLRGRSYAVSGQARLSPELDTLVARGGFAIYQEKTQGGLTILDRDGRPLFETRYPTRAYASFAEIPPVLVNTLLYIEDRGLLSRQPTHNPAIDWSRMPVVANAAFLRLFDDQADVPGGSTLATQIEKYRHSPGGQTLGAGDKLRQMLAASQRAYLNGPDTLARRRQIAVDYLNSTPLSARPGFGEVNGLGDGLEAWYGTDFQAANRLLRQIDARSTPLDGLLYLTAGQAGESAAAAPAPNLAAQARVYKQTLSLLLAQRRPSGYLLGERPALRRLTDSYLHAAAAAGIISPALRDAALTLPLEISPEANLDEAPGAGRNKIQQTLRADLLSLLDERNLYALDRIDLTARATVDGPVQQAVAEILQRLADPQFAAAQGLTGPRLLNRGDPSGLAYSVTLFERGDTANYLRLRVDNLDRALDLNTGAKLDLGSTAKLRTLVTYLYAVATLHARYAALAPARLAEAAQSRRDALSQWAITYLRTAADRDLATMLQAAVQRRYSANPGEQFFTGGGLHTFANFDAKDNGRVVSVAEATRNSINLPFIRLMRDIVDFYMREADKDADALLRDHGNPERESYLVRFADREGSTFLRKFHASYRGKTRDEILATAATRARQRPNALAVVFRSVNPKGNVEEFANFVAAHRPGAAIGEAALSRIYNDFSADIWSLADRGYIAQMHPLELWLASYLYINPEATTAEMIAASEAQRREAYTWLFGAKRWRAQDTRIRIVLEEEAFEQIHAIWKKTGYPFDSLVPSLATALGSSADRPSALAELMGLILNDGVRLPVVRFDDLHFAAGTPYEIKLTAAPPPGERVLPPEVAAIVKEALLDVVENGTGRRARGAVLGAGGEALPIGGKTGTGDDRAKRFVGDRLVSSTVLNRNACLVFFVGDRYFGTIVAHVKGPEAANYSFTSALPAQILKILGPALAPLVQRPGRYAADAVSAAGQAALQ